jgi:hypothetical protein
MIDEKELKSYIERLHNEHHGGKGDWHFRLALRKVLYFIDVMNKRGATGMDVIKLKEK